MPHGSLSLGLHIEDRAITLVALKKKRSSASIVHQAEVILPPGVVVQGMVKNTDIVVAAITKVFVDANVGTPRAAHVTVTLPEQQTFLTTVTIETDTKVKQDASTLDLAVQRCVPLPPSNLSYTATRIDQTKDSTTYAIYAANYAAVASWQAVFDTLNMKIEGFDIAAYAARRAVCSTTPKEPALQVTMGDDGTLISIVSPQGILYTEYCPCGIATITDAFVAIVPDIQPKKKTTKKKGTKAKKETNAEKVAEKEILVVDDVYATARNMLLEKGMAQSNKKAAQIVHTAMMDLATCIDQVRTYVEEVYALELQTILVCGPVVTTEKGVQFLQKEFSKFTVDARTPHGVNSDKDNRYLYALGVAWRNVHKKWDHGDPYISLTKPKVVVKSAIEIGTLSLPTQLTVDDDDRQKKKIQTQLAMLLLVLLAGGVLLLAAVAFRHAQPESKSALAARIAEQSVADIPTTPEEKNVDQLNGTLKEGLNTQSVEASDAVHRTTSSSVVLSKNTVGRIIGDDTRQYSVWNGPSTTSTVVAEVEVGEQVVVLDTVNDWYAIAFESSSTTGYIQTQFVEGLE